MSPIKRILDVPPQPWGYWALNQYLAVVLVGELLGFFVLMELLLFFLPDLERRQAIMAAGGGMLVSLAVGLLVWWTMGLIP